MSTCEGDELLCWVPQWFPSRPVVWLLVIQLFSLPKKHFHYAPLPCVVASASSVLQFCFFALLHPSHLLGGCKTRGGAGKPVNNRRPFVKQQFVSSLHINHHAVIHKVLSKQECFLKDDIYTQICKGYFHEGQVKCSDIFSTAMECSCFPAFYL